MPYVEPKDIPKIQLTWSDWPLPVRIQAARDLALSVTPTYTVLELQTAVVATTLEQPNRIPVNNVAGLMCFAESDGWGWKNWPQGRKPIGYALAKEGAVPGSVGVFLAFKSVNDSLAMLLSKIRSRHIWQGDIDTWTLDVPATAKAYAEKWVADPKQFTGAVSGFTAQAKKVLEAWPTNQER